VSFVLGCGSGFNAPAAATWYGAEYLQTSSQTAWINNAGATFYITGVQLEAGTVASPFEQIDYGRELMMCQRYYYKNFPGAANVTLGSGFVATTTIARIVTPFPVSMRAAPTALEQSGTASDYKVAHTSTSTNCSSVPTFANASTVVGASNFTVASGLTAGQGNTGESNATAAYLAWSAEL
jgi:hypothetical protein